MWDLILVAVVFFAAGCGVGVAYSSMTTTVGKLPKRTTVTELGRTSNASPSQWEGRTKDGGYVHIHYRWGCLRVGLGESQHDSVLDAFQSDPKRIGKDFGVYMEESDMFRLTAGILEFELTHSATIRGERE